MGTEEPEQTKEEETLPLIKMPSKEADEESQCRKDGLKRRLLASPFLHSIWSHEYLLTFLFVFGFQLIWIFQGLDVQDEGYHLTNQVATFSAPASGDAKVTIFLSDFFGGMWLALIGRPSLLWARLGFVVLNALNAVIVLRILVDHFCKRRAVLVVVVSALVITSLYLISTIHYFSFPTLLINIQLLLFHLLLKEERETRRWRALMVMIGFMVVPIVLSRVTLALIVLAPVTLILYERLTKCKTTWLKDAFLYGSGGVVISLCVFSALLFAVGFLDEYISWVFGFIGSGGDIGSPGHDPLFLLSYYLRHAASICMVIGGILVGGWLVNMARERFGRRIIDIGLPVLFLFGLITLYFLRFYMDKYYSLIFKLLYTTPYAIMVIGFVFLAGLIYITFKERSRDISYLLLIGLFVCFIYPLGSNTGLMKGAYATWLVLPLAVLVLWEMNEKTDRDEKTRERKLIACILGWGRGIIPKNTTLIVILLLIGSVFINYGYVFDDNHPRTELVTEFESQGLEGIYSIESRVEEVDDLMMHLLNYTEPGDKVLFVNHMPIFYYLTETNPAYESSWPLMKTSEAVEEMHREAIANGNIPKIFVYANVTNIHIDRYQISLDFLIQEYTVELGYRLLWKNEAFTIYGNPEIFN